MRHLLLSIALLLSLSAGAQKVLSVDINTTSKKFAVAMLKKGYKPTEKVAGETYYSVTYAGYKNTKMKVLFDEANDSIREVSLYFDNRTIKERSDIFDKLQEQFKAKYPNGEASRHDWDVINTHQRWFNVKSVVSMMYDEVDGNFWISYHAKYKPKKKVVRPSDDI